MSDILEGLAILEEDVVVYQAALAREIAQQENAKWTSIPMPHREELLAEAMTNAEHIYIGSLSKAQQKVALLRLDIGDRWPKPDVMDSYLFLVSEIGEVGDALLRANYGHRGDYVRNHPKQTDVVAELGDAYLMLCTLATCLGVDLDAALQDCMDKLRSKHGVTEPEHGA